MKNDKLTRHYVFEQIGKEHPEIYDKYRNVLDANDLLPQRIEDINTIIAGKNINGFVKYFEDLFLSIGQEDIDALKKTIIRSIDREGFEKTASTLLKNYWKKVLSDFLDTVTKYIFTDDDVKWVVNSFIDDMLKFGNARSNLEAQLGDKSSI